MKRDTVTEERPGSHLFELGIFFRVPDIGKAYRVERRLRWFLARFGWLLGIRDEWAISGADLIPTKRLGTPRGLR